MGYLYLCPDYHFSNIRHFPPSFHAQRKKASDERTRFFINTAHDIRTPLTLIKAPLEEIQQKENLSEESQANMLTAMKNVDTLIRLTTNLINFSKANVYSSSLRISEHELNTYMEGIYHAFYSYAEHNSSPRISGIIMSDNTKSGLNSGMIFKASFPLVRIHKGKISIESVENKGTRVKVIFPQKQFRSQQVPTETVQQENVVPVSPSAVSPHTYKDQYRQHVQNAQRILVVEDHDDLREYLSHTLSEAYQVETCTNVLL